LYPKELVITDIILSGSMNFRSKGFTFIGYEEITDTDGRFIKDALIVAWYEGGRFGGNRKAFFDPDTGQYICEY
jgi:hypothetical protein